MPDNGAPLIKKLETVTINRIAAGEVVQRPFNAVKELIENSMDAGSTSISVLAKGGGLDMLQIQDNGHGIRHEDLGIVCERFTTSKITSFDDLKKVTTYGFRGEALASVTHVATVTILSKTANAPCAYKSRYRDGVLVPLKPNDKALPQPCAGTVGTTITVEDLFHNMHTRKTAFKNTSDEYRKILDVVTKYSVHFGDRGVAFTCKKHGQATPDLHTLAKSSVLDNIKLIYGPTLAHELIALDVAPEEGQTQEAPEKQQGQDDGPPGCQGQGGGETTSFRFSGWISNANYSAKKGTYIIFINNRLVDCAAIRRVLDAVYNEVLPKTGHPFCYVSLTVPPHHVDVNVHPTKKEVHFLHEDRLLEALHRGVRRQLEGANQSRTFYSTRVLIQSTDGLMTMGSEAQAGRRARSAAMPASKSSPSSSEMANNENVDTQDSPPASDAVSISRKRSVDRKPVSLAPSKMVRTDATMTRIDAFYQHVPTQQGKAQPSQGQSSSSRPSHKQELSQVPGAGWASRGSGPGTDCACCPPTVAVCLQVMKKQQDEQERVDGARTGRPAPRLTLPPLPRTKCQYDSVLGLLSEMERDRHTVLSQALRQHVFVGCVDKSHSLLQVGTKLMLVDHGMLMQELFRQLALRRFGESSRLNLAEPLSVLRFVRTALDCAEVAWAPQDGDKDHIAARVDALLKEKADMLQEYFNIRITPNGLLLSLPDLLPGYVPDPAVLPIFLLRLATEVDWDDERACFATIAQELGILFSELSEHDVRDDGDGLGDITRSMLTHQIFPALKAYLYPPRSLEDTAAVVQVAALEELYRVFERC